MNALDTINRIKSIVSYLPILGIILLISAIPFHYGWYHRISLYILTFTYILDYIANQRWKNWQWSNKYWVYICQIAFFLLIPVWHIFDEIQTPILQRTIENYMPFLILGICGIIGTTDKFRIEYVALAMIFTSIAIISYILNIVGFPDFASISTWVSNFNYISHQHINSHMVLNLYWNFSLILGLYLVWRSNFSKAWKVIIALLMTPIFIALCITDGRTGLLTLVGIILILLVYYMYSHRKWWMIGVVLGFLVGAYAFLMQREDFIRATSETNPRIYIWNVTIDMIKEKPLLGYGVCSARNEFVERGVANEEFYENYTQYLIRYLQTANIDADLSIMHPHNALLETWIQFGIIGVLLLLTYLVLPLTMRLGQYQLFLNLCVFAFVMQSIFESFGSCLQPLCLCLMILFWHHQFTLSHDNKSAAELQPL
jgi:O-antigen ligase